MQKKKKGEHRKKKGKKCIEKLEAQVVTEASKDKSDFPRHHDQIKRRPSLMMASALY